MPVINNASQCAAWSSGRSEINTHATAGAYSTTEPSEYSQTKWREPAARLAARFQVA
jgi:hypothetical protein